MAANSILYRGQTYTKLKSGNCYLVTSLPFSDLEANTLNVTIESDDTSLLQFTRGDPMIYQYKETQVGTFYVQTVERISANLYRFSATSAIGILTESLHYGGIYTGQFAKDIITDICGDVPVTIKTSLQSVKVFGWLPIASPRDNLAQVLFAIGATVTTDLDGILRIEGIWDGMSGVTSANAMFQSAKVDYGATVTQVRVTEHQYIPVATEDAVQLFEGASEQGDIITFDEPMFDLVATGFTILSSGANFAEISGGSGTLTGFAYTHNTRTVAKAVSDADRPNVKVVEDATLVSLANANAVAERLATFYASTETIDAPTVFRGEQPGDCRQIYHPYDKQLVEGCLQSVDINLSNTLKAQEKSLVGYVPPQSGDVAYFDYNEVIDTNGTWTVPEGVTSVRVVLIGGGQGGWSGNPGDNAPSQTPRSFTETVLTMILVYVAATRPTLGGDGGDPGTPGQGGSVWQGTIDVTPGQTFAIDIGVGGLGGQPGEESAQGSLGTPTTFGNLSSSDGSILPAGFLDPITSTLFAATGEDGYAGGRGTGAEAENDDADDWVYIPGETLTIDGTDFTPGANGSSQFTGSQGNFHDDYGRRASGSYMGYGGGPAYGANGNVGNTASARVYDTSVWASGGPGGNGADALPPAQSTLYGTGGTGGSGGGGAGGSGGARAQCEVYKNEGLIVAQTVVGQATPARGGQGSNGGQGADGCVLLYYSKPETIESGAVQDSQGRMILDKFGRIFVV